MLHRFLFVTGMTIGVMAPLVWAACVLRPDTHTAQAPTAALTRAVPEEQMPTRTAMMDSTASIPSAPAMPTPPKTEQVVSPPKPLAPPRAIAQPPARPAAKPVHPRPTAALAARRTRERTLPAVVDSYNGAHIITICAALTENEQLRAGCP